MSTPDTTPETPTDDNDANAAFIDADRNEAETPTAGQVHELKTDPEVFDAVRAGYKQFEIRFNDRQFQVGDRLRLRKTRHTGAEMRDGAPLVFTGEEIHCRVTYALHGPIYGLMDSWVILGIDTLAAQLAQAQNEIDRLDHENNGLKDLRECDQKQLAQAQQNYQSMCINRDHFCEYINKVAKHVGMTVENAAPYAVEQHVLRIIEQLAQAQGDLARANRFIVHFGDPEGDSKFYGDHACAQCHPYSEILKDGFVCAYHAALAKHQPDKTV